MEEKSNLKAPYIKTWTINTSFLPFSRFIFDKTQYYLAFHTSRQAPRCGVDDKCFHDVAHNKSRHDEQEREDFSPSSAP
jgi:hypothetical protein